MRFKISAVLFFVLFFFTLSCAHALEGSDEEADKTLSPYFFCYMQ